MREGGPDITTKVQQALERCRVSGLRRTKALERILSLLISEVKPLTLQTLSQAMEDQCDRATVYRLLVRLEEKGIVRRLGFHQRSSHYAMRYPDQHDDYLICTECGSIDTLDVGCPVESMEREVSERWGFRRVYHELEFFGVCPDCGDQEERV